MKFKVLVLSFLFVFSVSIRAQDKKKFVKDFTGIIKENNPHKIVAGMSQLIKNYKLDTLRHAEEIDIMKGSVAIAFLKQNDFKNFEHYLSLIKNRFNQTSYMNIAAEILNESKKDIDYAGKLAEKTIQLYESYREDPKAF